MAENKLPIEEFERIRSEHDSFMVRSSHVLGTLATEEAGASPEPCNVLREITDVQSGLVDLNMFSDLIDLFMYLPNKERVNDQLSSQHIHSLISPQLQKNKKSVNGREALLSKSDLKNERKHGLMQEIWTRVQERFTGMSAAFRFFDRNCTG